MSLTIKPKTWEKRASCLGFPAVIFYPEDIKPETSAQALEICRNCPVRLQCLEQALIRNESEGIWGGTLPQERRSIRRKKITASKYLQVRCGTEDGYQRHKKTGQEICEECQTYYYKSILNGKRPQKASK